MSAPMNEPAHDHSCTPPDPTHEVYGVYNPLTYTDLTAGRMPVSSPSMAPPGQQLSEEDYAPGRFGSGADVDRHIDNQECHSDFYGESGPKPFPV